jgi:hypothetical protein
MPIADLSIRDFTLGAHHLEVEVAGIKKRIFFDVEIGVPS